MSSIPHLSKHFRTLALAIWTAVTPLAFALPATGQNLVPNPGFEEGVDGGCPTLIGYFDLECADWYASIQDPDPEWENLPNPDWYHECSGLYGLTPPGVAFGYQEPPEGGGYAGIVTYDKNVNSIPELENYREYIGVELLEPLSIGQAYLVEFKIARLFAPATTLASNNMGFKFTTFPYFQSAAAATDNFAHFHVDTIISDTTNWIQISEEFIADSAYTHFHIGNFCDDDHTNVIYYDENGSSAYYAVDDVRISAHLGTGRPWKHRTGVRVFPNPVEDVFNIKCRQEERIKSVQIRSMRGVRVSGFTSTKENPNFWRIALTHFPRGTYIVQIKSDKATYHEKIIKTE